MVTTTIALLRSGDKPKTLVGDLRDVAWQAREWASPSRWIHHQRSGPRLEWWGHVCALCLWTLETAWFHTKSRVRRKKVFGLERQAFHAGLPLSDEASHTLPTLLQWPSLLPTTTQTPENGLVYGMYEKRNEYVGSTVGQRQGQGWRGHHSTQRTHDHAVAWQHVAAIRTTGPRTKEVLPHGHGQPDDGRALAR